MRGHRLRQGEGKSWDHSSDSRFVEYYAKASASEETVQRYQTIHDVVLRIRGDQDGHSRELTVADIGCGAGAQCLIWAREGHRVFGLDLNRPLLDLAKERAAAEDQHVQFVLGSATDLPWGDESMDICLVPELLEHVKDWRSCLAEFARILRPGGVLYLSTTNRLCPVQQEFNLPLYSWYPPVLKRRFERLARTTRPELANFATYPAVNWFSFYGLRRELSRFGLESMDRFDVMDLSSKPPAIRWLVRWARVAPPLRWFAHVASSSTIVVAVRPKR